MGAWGYGSFDNDGAWDWMGDFENDCTVTFLEHTFLALIDDKGDWFDVDSCSAVVAAAEVVAESFGKGGPQLPDRVKELVQELAGNKDEKLKKLARDALHLVINDKRSELKSLWEEGDQDAAGGNEWKEILIDLQQRLQ